MIDIAYAYSCNHFISSLSFWRGFEYCILSINIYGSNQSNTINNY